MKNELPAKVRINILETAAIRLAKGNHDRKCEEYINKFRRDYREGKLAGWQIQRVEQIPGWTWDDPVQPARHDEITGIIKQRAIDTNKAKYNDAAQAKATHEAVRNVMRELNARFLYDVIILLCYKMYTFVSISLALALVMPYV